MVRTRLLFLTVRNHFQWHLLHCKLCDNEVSFSWKKQLELHIKTVHDKVSFNCDQCDKSFIDKKSLNVHKNKLHVGQLNCNRCEKQFFTKQALKRHIQSIHEKIQYNCNQCDKIYFDKRILNVHIQSVHENVRYFCDQCGKSFPLRIQSPQTYLKH